MLESFGRRSRPDFEPVGVSLPPAGGLDRLHPLANPSVFRDGLGAITHIPYLPGGVDLSVMP